MDHFQIPKLAVWKLSELVLETMTGRKLETNWVAHYLPIQDQAEAHTTFDLIDPCLNINN